MIKETKTFVLVTQSALCRQVKDVFVSSSSKVTETFTFDHHIKGQLTIKNYKCHIILRLAMLVFIFIFLTALLFGIVSSHYRWRDVMQKSNYKLLGSTKSKTLAGKTYSAIWVFAIKTVNRKIFAAYDWIEDIYSDNQLDMQFYLEWLLNSQHIFITKKLS